MNSSSELKQALERSIDKELKRASEEILKRAAVEFNQQVRNMLGKAAAQIASAVRYEDYGNRVTIELHLGDPNAKK